jgi:hypothetical protein
VTSKKPLPLPLPFVQEFSVDVLVDGHHYLGDGVKNAKRTQVTGKYRGHTYAHPKHYLTILIIAKWGNKFQFTLRGKMTKNAQNLSMNTKSCPTFYFDICSTCRWH